MKTPKEITNAELALLCLLAEKPLHAYQIAQVIEERGMREWTSIGFSSIYYLLNKMYRAGWLERKNAESEIGGPAKHIFYLSHDGRQVWQKAVIKAITFSDHGDSPFMIGLSVIPLLETEQVSMAFETHLTHLEKETVRLKKKMAGYGKHIPTHVKAMFDYSLAQISASASWVRKWKNEFGES